MTSGDEQAEEGVVAEALVWHWLKSHTDTVEPGCTRGSRADFYCKHNDFEFFIEVTNISIKSATSATGLEHVPNHVGHAVSTWYGPINHVVKAEVSNKTPQLAELSAPGVVMVTTLHYQAGSLCFDKSFTEWYLHSPVVFAGRLDPARGEVIGGFQQVADFKDALFTKTRSLDPARDCISAVLTMGLGGQGFKARGVLNPKALRLLEPCALPHVPLCRFKNWPPTDHIQLEWLNVAQE